MASGADNPPGSRFTRGRVSTGVGSADDGLVTGFDVGIENAIRSAEERSRIGRKKTVQGRSDNPSQTKCHQQGEGYDRGVQEPGAGRRERLAATAGCDLVTPLQRRFAYGGFDLPDRRGSSRRFLVASNYSSGVHGRSLHPLRCIVSLMGDMGRFRYVDYAHD